MTLPHVLVQLLLYRIKVRSCKGPWERRRGGGRKVTVVDKNQLPVIIFKNVPVVNHKWCQCTQADLFWLIHPLWVSLPPDLGIHFHMMIDACEKEKKRNFYNNWQHQPNVSFFFFLLSCVSVCLCWITTTTTYPIELNKISLTKEKKTENLRKISNDNQIIQKPNLNSNKNNRCLQRIRIYDHVWNHRNIMNYSRRNPRNTDNSWWFASNSFRQGNSFPLSDIWW